MNALAPLASIAIEWSRPYAIGAAILIALIVFYFWRSLSELPLWQRRISLIVRSTILLLLALSLTGLVLLLPTRDQYILVAVDSSWSVDTNAKQEAIAFLKECEAAAPTGTEFAYLSFGSSTTSVASSVEELSELKFEQQQNSNLAVAIESSTAAIPPTKVAKVLLLSDGLQTQGDALSVAANSQVPISTRVLSTRKTSEVQVTQVRAPSRVREGESFYLDVVVHSNHEDQGTLDIFKGDFSVLSNPETITVKPGENRFRFPQTIENENRSDFTVQLSGFQDELDENNKNSAIVFASGKPTILLIDPIVEELEDLRMALEEQSIRVETRSIEGLPQDISELQKFDSLILSNVAATSISQQQMLMIRTYVQELGGGLVVLGGDQAFGMGGYYKSQLEEVLPVYSDFEKEQEKPSLAMVLVIDKSGSMGGDKIELSKEAARGTAELLGVKDQLGVIAFDGDAYWVSELRPASEKNEIIDRISTIIASGGTNLYPGLVEAMQALQATTAKIKHVIVLSDGHSTPADFSKIAADLQQARITLSTVAVSEESDRTLLEDLANWGGGRYYYCQDARAIPQIFAKETISASKSAIQEEPFQPQVLRASSLLKDIDLQNAPPLLGYVVTRPKPTSELVLTTERSDPLLVWWRYGLGTTIAFTSDAKAQWSAEWLSWSDFGQFWSQIVRHSLRKPTTEDVDLDFQVSNGEFRFRLDSFDANGAFLNKAKTEMTLVTPDLASQKVSFDQIGPGLYEGRVSSQQLGTHLFEIQQRVGSNEKLRHSLGYVAGYPDEYRLLPPDQELLKSIAQSSGGVFNPTAEQLVTPDDREAYRVRDLWKPILAVASLLLILDIFLRRIDLSPYLLRLSLRKQGVTQ